MRKSEYMEDPGKHLELLGFENITALDVYALPSNADAILLRSLESFGYVRIPNIKLTNGQTVDGWMKI